MAKDFVILSTRIPKELSAELEKMSKKRKKTVSKFLRELVENELDYLSEEDMCCDECKKPIKANEKYFSDTFAIEKYTKEKGELIVEPLDSFAKEILCLKCAKKRKRLKNLKFISV